jgi:hemolysin activation/secretion protein
MKLVKQIFIIVSITSCVFSATPPKIGDIQKEVTPPKIEKKKKILPSLEKQKPKSKKIQKDGKKIYIEAIKLDDLTYIGKKKIEAITDLYGKKELSFSKIEELVSKLTKLYRDSGYFLAKVYIPKQDISQNGNVLELKLNIGEYGELDIKNNSLVHTSIIDKRVQLLKKQKAINSKDIEKVLLNINSLSGVEVGKIDIKASKQKGASDIKIGFDSTKKYDGYILGDNHGSKFTGEHRVLLGFNLNSPFKIGDKISFNGMLSSNNDLKSKGIDYSFPLYKNGLSGSIGYSKVGYKLGDTYKSLDALGDAESFYLKVTYPAILNRNESLNLYGKYEKKDMKDEIRFNNDITNKSADILRIGTKYTKTLNLNNKPNSFNIDTYFTRGDLKFKDAQKKIDDENSVKTNGNFSKLNIDIENTLYLNEKYSLNTKGQFQKVFGKNLDGSEDFSLGGANGIRLYPSSESSAENGYLIKNELFFTLPTKYSINSKIGLFYEIGQVHTHNNVTSFESRKLQDMGLSYKGSYKDIFVDMSYARKVGSQKITSQNDYNSKFLFQIGYIF